MFAVGDYVVYGSNGICMVRDISKIDIPGAPGDRIYYLLSPVGSKDSKIYSPVDNTKVIMRRILNKEEAQELLEGISDIPEIPAGNDKLMELKYKEIISSCDLCQLVSLIKTIRRKRNKRLMEGKKITTTDERYLKKAEESLFGELMIALGKDRNELEDILKEI
ncbi:MAG: CarD family transcriptional regulator [Thermoflexaceae bacterium]|nr:CarD family transcriptional regulator [Thermoflexaceae bacterium]